MNAKIEKTIAEINKTKDKIAEYQAKLRTLEQQKITLENEEIVALYRKEKLTEDDFIAYIKARREAAEGNHTATAPPALAADFIRAGKKEDEPGNED